MPRYNVSYVEKDWVSIIVDADTEEQAKVKARKKLDAVYDKSGIDVNDCKTEFVGITNEDALDFLND
jgi:hypothetical protein